MSMTVPLIRLALLTAMSATCAGAAFAQSQPPQREDNHWGGLSHQPTEEQVLQSEKATGIARPSPQEKAVNQDVEQMYQSLMGAAPASGARPP